ncbi:hypothetical protein RRF57_000953 [Xylaria bambusicola]|uniref:Uncharacterized protein n=1 Tax=Xylaria bambusicola TaxID=326684 RepID=A0AAN7Z171_9PEZI
MATIVGRGYQFGDKKLCSVTQAVMDAVCGYARQEMNGGRDRAGEEVFEGEDENEEVVREVRKRNGGVGSDLCADGGMVGDNSGMSV